MSVVLTMFIVQYPVLAVFWVHFSACSTLLVQLSKTEEGYFLFWPGGCDVYLSHITACLDQYKTSTKHILDAFFFCLLLCFRTQVITFCSTSKCCDLLSSHITASFDELQSCCFPAWFFILSSSFSLFVTCLSIICLPWLQIKNHDFAITVVVMCYPFSYHSQLWWAKSDFTTSVFFFSWCWSLQKLEEFILHEWLQVLKDDWLAAEPEFDKVNVRLPWHQGCCDVV